MPKRVDHEERRAQIAAALMRVAARDGLAGISLRHVGAEAGVTSGMVQHYFPTRDDMMHYAMDAASNYFAGLGGPPPDLTGPPAIEDQIVSLLGSLLPMDQQRRDAGLATLAFTAYAATNQAAAKKLAWGNTQLRGHIEQLLSEAREVGLLAAKVDPTKAAAAVLATTEGLGLHCLTGGLDPQAAAESLKHQVSLLFTGRPRVAPRAVSKPHQHAPPPLSSELPHS